MLADRGYTCKHLFAEKGATLLTPAFKPRDGQPMSEEDIEVGRFIARARIHIERYNDR